MAQDNKYLTFQMSDEHYAIPIQKVKEIISMMKITKVPRLPKFMVGVINLRGKMIPIVDLRIKFGLDERSYDERTSIIVIETEAGNSTKTNGIIVDSVQEVLDIPAESIEPPPKHGNGLNREILTGMGKVNDDVVMLLEADMIFAADEKEGLESA